MSDRAHERRHIEAQIAPLARFLDEPGIFEIVVNKPGEVWIERPDGWQVHAVPDMTFARLEHLAKVIAAWSRQAIDAQRPILSATLPGNERVQIVLPPAVTPNTISMTLRKPSSTFYTLADLQRRSLFAAVKRSRDTAANTDADLADLLEAGDVEAFLRTAVKAHKNIIISGATGSGKTTLSKALIAEIPADERIITIEDTPELVVPHKNAVQLFYSKGGQGAAKVGPKELLESCLRMRPDRILLQELRDGTAFYYIRNVNSGHPGSITTVHADSAALAFEQLTLLVKESDGGADLDRADIRHLLTTLVDVVVQMKRVGGHFRVTEIHFARRDRAASAKS
jgi:type IV secretion system protein VirB11